MSVTEMESNAAVDKSSPDLPPSASNEPIIKRTRKPRHPIIKAMFMLLRRSHLYFGLLLAPWALLYGITAYLFNHPTHFSTNTFEYLPASTIPSGWITKNWDPTERAQSVIDELNQRFSNGDRAIQLSARSQPRFDGAFINASLELDHKTYNLSLPLHGETTGSLRISPKRIDNGSSGKKAFFDIAAIERNAQGRESEPRKAATSNATRPSPASEKGSEKQTALQPSRNHPLQLEADLERDLKQQIAEVVAQLGIKQEIAPESVRLVSIPKLFFQAESKDELWDCRHDALVGSVSTKEAFVASDFSWRRFLLRLHTAHGYPAEGGARWYWAIVVDIMAFVMVFWGVSGIVMWWQIKSTRRWGTAAMVASLVLAFWLGIGMYLGMQ